MLLYVWQVNMEKSEIYHAKLRLKQQHQTLVYKLI